MVNYKDAGVDTQKKESMVKDIRGLVESTFTQDVISTKTTFKFGGTISLSRFVKYKDPVLVLSTDGVGTKTMIALAMNKFDTIGADIVNHGINDVLTSGAKSLFFLDYIAASKLSSKIIRKIVEGIARQCRKNNIILSGGETAEMPGIYRSGMYDIAGTVGGIVERDKIIDGTKIKEDNILIGLKSSGLHTNGYSLARKIFFEDNKYNCDSTFPELDNTLGETLLQTHKEYATQVLPLVDKQLINGVIHITGGGFPGNIPRVIPNSLGARIDPKSWQPPPIFQLIQKIGKVSTKDMLSTFNMGIGIVLVVNASNVSAIQGILRKNNDESFVIGSIVGKKGVHYEGY